MAKALREVRKVVIIGGGPAALLAALRLKKSNGISPVLYEIRDKPTSLGGAIGIPANGLRLLHQIGLYEEVAAKGALTSSIILHTLSGTALGEMDMSSWSKRHTGFGYLRARRTDVMDVLLKAAEREDIPVHFGRTLSSIVEKDDQVTIRFADGSEDTSDFLLGCDGIHSSVRRLYIDPDMKPEYTGISNMFSLVPTDNLQDVNGLSTVANNLNATITPSGLFGLSPTTPRGDVLYWFFSRQVPLPAVGDVRSGWESHGKAEVDACKSTLLHLFRDDKSDWMKLLRHVVNGTEAIKFYPIYKIPPGRPWFRGRCLLIGDAAHAMPPHASQGVSMALEDIFLLSKFFRTCEEPDVESALKVFVERRKLRTDAMLKTAERNGSVRKDATPWRLRANELAISGGLWLYKLAGLERFGFGQRDVVYDIEGEKF